MRGREGDGEIKRLEDRDIEFPSLEGPGVG
jgi:hypothetical protein